MGFCAYTNKSSRWTLWGAWLAAHIQMRDFSPADVSGILQQTAQIYLSTIGTSQGLIFHAELALTAAVCVFRKMGQLTLTSRRVQIFDMLLA